MIESISFASLKWINPLIKKLLKIKKDQEAEIKEIVNTFGDPLLFLKYYVEPNCQHKNPADDYEDEPLATPKGSVFSLLNNFLSIEFINRDGANQMFLLADAGMGKTSLLIFLKISQLTSFWRNRYNCELFKLDKNTIEKIKKIPNPRRTVLLLDALDEDPSSRINIENRLFDLLSVSKQFHRVIISCRTKYIDHKYYSDYDKDSKIYIGPYQCPCVYLSLFDGQQVYEYLSKRYPDSLRNKILKTKNKSLNKSLEIINKMNSLKLRPLLLSYIDEFIDEDPKLLNEYAVYDILIEKWINREIRKIHHNDGDYSISPEMLFLACAQIACYMHIEDSRIIHKDQLNMLSIKAPVIKVLKGFDMGGRSLLNKNSDGSYRFSHYSIQEFLVSYAIRRNSLSSMKKPVRLTDMMRVFLFKDLDIKMKFKQVELKSITFKNESMRKCDFSFAGLNTVKFIKCDLRDANFSSSEMHNVQFIDCKLTDAYFIGCTITKSSFINVEANNSNFNNSEFFKSQISGSLFKHVKFIDVKCINTSIEGTDLREGVFSSACIRESLLEKCKFNDNAFENSSLENAKFLPKKKSDSTFNWRMYGENIK